MNDMSPPIQLRNERVKRVSSNSQKSFLVDIQVEDASLGIEYARDGLPERQAHTSSKWAANNCRSMQTRE
ncbi:hypothetical protein O3M35_007610 [Rhynocoris fuscipes]|uniref:Uncharacterized protein n=1 Tax=Rhynocoris fuscipes TaxID=488301 RepID=A0AAW1DAV4_9HEMI